MLHWDLYFHIESESLNGKTGSLFLPDIVLALLGDGNGRGLGHVATEVEFFFKLLTFENLQNQLLTEDSKVP